MTSLIFPTDLPPKLPKRSQSTPRWKKPRMEARKLLTYLYELAEMATHDQYQLETLTTSANSFLEKQHLPVSLRLGLAESLLDAMIRITTQMALITLWLILLPRTPHSENFSYKELTTFTKIWERVTLVCITAKLQISLDEQQRIAKTWRLLMDYRIAFVIARLARDQYNYHCADLIEMFTNIVALSWKSPDPAGGNLDQLAVDLMRQILTADVERYVVPALDTIKDTNVGITKQQNKPENLILTNHWFQSTKSTHDLHRATRCLMSADNKSREIWNLTGQI